jgi:hypothetical protein
VADKVKFSKNGQWTLDKADETPKSIGQTPSIPQVAKPAKPENQFTAKFSHSMPMHEEQVMRMMPKKKGANKVTDFVPNGGPGFQSSIERHHYFDIFHKDQKVGKIRVTTEHMPDADEPSIAEYGGGYTSHRDETGKEINRSPVAGVSDSHHLKLIDKLDQLEAVDPEKFKNSFSQVVRAIHDAHDAEAESDKGHLHYRDYEHLVPKKLSN